MVCLKGKVALITGASSGIGAATAVHFCRLGCSVAVNGRNTQNLENTVVECLKTGITKDKVLSVLGDVSKEEDAASIVQMTLTHFGKLDILVNNAGFSIMEPELINTSLTIFDHIMETNVRGLFNMVQLAVPHLKKTKGNIVNMSSAISHRKFPHFHIYAASKSAVDSLTKSLAISLAEDGIRVNGINPGSVLTNHLNTAGIPADRLEGFKKATEKFQAMGRMAEPIEIAKPIAFLASSDASFMTGTVLLVDGGFVLIPTSA